jgi:hypothetical protein
METDQPGTEHFDFASYATKPRWNSYWHQLDETFAAKPATCLVVGGGDAVVPQLLRAAGIDVTVVDVVEDLNPDRIADVRDLPFEDDQFDAALCCQVLEHIPFDTVPAALVELRRVTKSKVTISLPDCSRSASVDVRIGRGRRVRRRVEFAKNRLEWTFNGVHHWEIGAGNYPLPMVRETIAREFSIDNEYRVDENTYHRFFVLTPSRLNPAAKPTN